MELNNRRSVAAEHIGAKIKQLRLSHGMTQKELAGDVISRNMLSMIESGNALPSIETLLHISKLLSVSPGLFFADENESMLYEKQQSIESVYRLLEGEEYGNASVICRQFADHDMEMRSLLVMCHIKQAESFFERYMLASASRQLSLAAELASSIPFIGNSIITACNFAVAVAECVSKDTVPDSTADLGKLSETGVPISFLSYLTAYKALKEGRTDISGSIAHSGLLGEFHSLHIRGAAFMAEGDHEAAIRLLDLALTSDGGGFFSRYKLLCDLEICRKNIGDYEMAYSLSTSRMEMLGMFSG